MADVAVDFCLLVLKFMIWRGAKVSAPLVFAEGKEYNRQCSGKRFLKCVLRHTGRGTDMIALHF